MKEVLILKEPKNAITEPTDVFKEVKKVNVDFEQENFILICLNSKNQITDSRVLFKGGLNACLVDPKTLFRTVLLNNSNSVIIAHNHPSGNLNPSQEDIKIYEQLKKGGELLQISVLDSIIFNKKEFYSLNRDC